MRSLRPGTRARLTAISVLVVASALALAGAALYLSLARAEQASADAVLLAQAQVIQSSLDVVNGQPALDTADLPAETRSGIAVDAEVIAGGAVIAHTTNQPLAVSQLGPLAAEALRTHQGAWADMQDAHGVDRRVYAVPVDITSQPDAVMVVSRSVGELRASLRQVAWLAAGVGLGLVMVVGVLTYWLAGRALAPVRRIASLARSISERDLHRRVEVDVPADELGELVTTFNAMLARLDAAFESLRRFTADASHELRAPLAVMRIEVEGALSHRRQASEYQRVLQSLGADIEHLGRLSDHLLMLARADAGVLGPHREVVDVADLLAESAARWTPVAARAQVRLRVDGPSAGQVAADPRLLRRVMDNLIDNALRHSPPGTEVAITAAAHESGWDIEVADQGPGVPAELAPRLFERFASADGARTPGGSGAGLGLALSAAIARAHGGQLTQMRANGTGARFRLHLPLDGAPLATS